MLTIRSRTGSCSLQTYQSFCITYSRTSCCTNTFRYRPFVAHELSCSSSKLFLQDADNHLAVKHSRTSLNLAPSCCSLPQSRSKQLSRHKPRHSSVQYQPLPSRLGALVSRSNTATGAARRFKQLQTMTTEPAVRPRNSSYTPNWQTTFQKGVAISVWQNSSDLHSNWTHFMKQKNYFGQHDFIAAFNESNNFWHKYEDDIQLVKALGCNSFRFSFEWSRIEPRPGQIDSSAIAQYHRILDSIDAAGLIPNATFHHFTHPQWFEARGGFSNPNNLPSFENYCTLIFQEFGVRIPFWATFNEPSCFCLCGYIMGLWAPGKRLRIHEAGKILGNMLKAHVQVYRKLKAMPYGDVAQIGIVHQHIRFVPDCNPLAGIIVRPVCHWMTYWFATQQMLNFFTTGKFTWKSPFLGTVVEFEDPQAVGALDWWGINYYSRPAINSKFQLVGLDDSEPLTGMGMPLVPGDLHHHLLEAHSALRVPLIVSETGVSDERHVLRAQCIQTYYNEVLRAIAHGADVRGVYYWTLMDNIEWHHGFKQHFGLYEWRPTSANGIGGPGRPTDGCQLQLRQGSKALVDLHAAWPETWQELKQFAQERFRNREAMGQVPIEANVLGLHQQQQQQQQQRDGSLGVGMAPAGIAAGRAGDRWLPEQQRQQQQQALREAVEADEQQFGDRGAKEPLLSQVGVEPGKITDVV